MAANTTNLGLIKPAGTDKVRIAQINQNMDIIDEKIGQVGNTSLQAQVAALGSGLAIVSNGNTHVAITSGQYVYIRNHSSLSEGLYKARAAIAANVALTTSNVTKSTMGSANDLKSAIDSVNSQKVAHALGNDTIENIQSAIVTLAGTMADGEVKKVRCNISAKSGVFRITAYIGELMRISSSRLCVDFRESMDANEAVIGNYKDGTWYWEELATKDQITTKIISVQAYDNRVSWDATSDPATIKKVGNVCMLSGYITYQFNPTSSQTSVIVLPSGCIPATNVYGVCTRNSDRKMFMTQISSAGNFNIFNDGQISSGDKIYIGFTYIVG